jgi:membrane protein implicated in regulation of membrane protease activity
VLVIAELVTGTFFLLVLGIAAFAGSATAWFGLGFWVEALCAATVAVVGVFWVRQQRKSMAHADMAPLDVGQAVTFDAWVSRDQGVARVKYRNTQWDAVVDGEPDLDQGQVLFIHAVDGNTLKVAKRKP